MNPQVKQMNDTAETSSNIQDFTELTCTNLMLKLKILVKRLPSKSVLEFYSNREQYDNIQKPFSKKGLNFDGILIKDNLYHCKITKVK